MADDSFRGKSKEEQIHEARRRLKKLGMGCLTLLLLIPICWALLFFFGSFFYPWSSPFFGETLTGTWVGRVQIPNDSTQRGFAFHIQLDSESEESEPIKGTADLCDSTGLRHTFYLRGTTNFRGNSLTLSFPNNPDFMEVQSDFRVSRKENEMTLSFTTKQREQIAFTAEKSNDRSFQELCRSLSTSFVN